MNHRSVPAKAIQISKSLLLVQFSTQLLPKSVLSGGIKAFAAVLCSFCHEVQHSFNKTATIVAAAAAAAAIVALTYWDCHNEPPLGADACISWKKKKKVHWSRLVFGKAVHMILVLPLLFILSSFVGYLPSFSIPRVNSLLFSPFVPPLKR